MFYMLYMFCICFYMLLYDFICFYMLCWEGHGAKRNGAAFAAILQLLEYAIQRKGTATRMAVFRHRRPGERQGDRPRRKK